MNVQSAAQLYAGKNHAILYAKYRPTNSDDVFKRIFDFVDEGTANETRYNMAVDVGCGNGQSTRPLCEKYSHVIGYDESVEQINAVRFKAENLQYKVGPAEDLGFLENESVDLLTVGSALHLFDREAFYKELFRVLKPGGVFAAYSYSDNILDDDTAQCIVDEFYKTIEPYFDKRQFIPSTRYQELEIPFEDQKRIDGDEMAIERDLSVDDYVGYMSTWYGWQKYEEQHPRTTAIEDVRQKLKEVYNGRLIKVIWPEFLLLGRKK